MIDAEKRDPVFGRSCSSKEWSEMMTKTDVISL